MGGITPWYVVPALAAIGRHVRSTTQSITAADLSAWATDAHIDFQHGIAEMALSNLQNRGYLAAQNKRHFKNGAVNRWHLTATGVSAAQAAWRALPCGPAPDMQALSTRLWNLLRIRRRITAAEAAQTLIDADDNFDAKTKRIAALLLTWSRAHRAVVIAQKREAGRARYVLINDLGRWPPPSRAGELHPSDFAAPASIPARYRKTESEQ